MNPYKAAARQKKSLELIAYIADRLTDEDVADPERILGGMEASDQSIRDLLAESAGVRPPSEETWALVVTGVRQRLEWMRRGRGLRLVS